VSISKKINFVAVPLFLLVAALGCNEQESDICSRYLPALRGELSNATIALQPWMPELNQNSPSQRSPASQVTAISLKDQEYWARWAERKMVEYQNLGDLVIRDSSRRELRGDLQTIAAQWVTFRGYAVTGNAPKMVETMARVRMLGESAIAKYCGESRSD
jgi:hypothetical protein